LKNKGLESDKNVVQNPTMKIGYARVSTDEQNLDLQLDALQAAGCDAVFQDQGVSGTAPQRPGLTTALGQASAGDVLVVWKLDRLGRSLLDLVSLVVDLNARGIGLKVLTGEGASIDTTRPEGRLIFAVFAAMAEFERDLIRERTREGIKAARRRGVTVGRPRKLTPHQIEHARQLLASTKEQRADIAALFGVDAVTLRRALRRQFGSP
jgi:DNA invertase Pin-like site-specific DNA recombinase